MRIAVISDTHSPRHWKGCPDAVARRLEGVDLILHAGDVCRRETLEELEGFAPVRAVLGNNDGPDVAAWGAPEVLELDLGGLAAARGAEGFVLLWLSITQAYGTYDINITVQRR